MDKTETISFLIGVEQLQQVDTLAQLEGRSRSSMLRKIIDAGFLQFNEEIQADERISLTPKGEKLVHVDDVIRVLRENLGKKQYPALTECPADTDI